MLLPGGNMGKREMTPWEHSIRAAKIGAATLTIGALFALTGPALLLIYRPSKKRMAKLFLRAEAGGYISTWSILVLVSVGSGLSCSAHLKGATGCCELHCWAAIQERLLVCRRWCGCTCNSGRCGGSNWTGRCGLCCCTHHARFPPPPWCQSCSFDRGMRCLKEHSALVSLENERSLQMLTTAACRTILLLPVGSAENTT